MFIESGGYVEEALSLNQAKDWQLYSEREILNSGRRLNGLTLFLGIGTIGLLLFEMYKFCFEHRIVFVCH